MCILLGSLGAGGGTRTHTTLPSRDFKSLASTSSATSAPFVFQGFLRFGQRMFCKKTLVFCKTGSCIVQAHAAILTKCSWASVSPSRSRLEPGPGHQQNRTDCHKENAGPVRSEPQESHAALWRLQSAANRPGGIRAAKRSPPNSSAWHVQDSAENEQRAKPHQEHSRLSVHRCRAQQDLDSIATWCDSFRAPKGVWGG